MERSLELLKLTNGLVHEPTLLYRMDEEIELEPDDGELLEQQVLAYDEGQLHHGSGDVGQEFFEVEVF